MIALSNQAQPCGSHGDLSLDLRSASGFIGVRRLMSLDDSPDVVRATSDGEVSHSRVPIRSRSPFPPLHRLKRSGRSDWLSFNSHEFSRATPTLAYSVQHVAKPVDACPPRARHKSPQMASIAGRDPFALWGRDFRRASSASAIFAQFSHSVSSRRRAPSSSD